MPAPTAEIVRSTASAAPPPRRLHRWQQERDQDAEMAITTKTSTR